MASRPLLYMERNILYLALVKDEYSIHYGYGTFRRENGKLAVDSGSSGKSLFFNDGRPDERTKLLSLEEGFAALEFFFPGITTDPPEVLMLKDLGYDTTVRDFGFYSSYSPLCQAIADLPRALLEGSDLSIRHHDFRDLSIPVSLFRRP